MEQNTFLLVANGELDCRTLERISSRTFHKIVAADGGALRALAYGMIPDVIIGDLDSVQRLDRTRLPQTEFIHQPSQELNDLEKALHYCREQGATHLVLLGLTGRRLDHTLNNLSVLSRYDRFFSLEIYDRYGQIFLVRAHFRYQGTPGQTISLIPLNTVAGVTTRGLKYPLQDEPLIFGQREGLSNEVVENPVEVTVRQGLLLVFVNQLGEYD